MAELTWESVMSSPDYINTMRQFEAAAARQFKAIPGAQENIRALPGAVAGRQIKLRDIGAKIDQTNRATDIQERELAMETKQLDRFERRAPIATAIGIGNLGLSALGSYANIKAMGRSDARFAQMEDINAQRGAAQSQQYETMTQNSQALSKLYQDHLARISALPR